MIIKDFDVNIKEFRIDIGATINIGNYNSINVKYGMVIDLKDQDPDVITEVAVQDIEQKLIDTKNKILAGKLYHNDQL